jgi:hypothetical protein
MISRKERSTLPMTGLVSLAWRSSSNAGECRETSTRLALCMECGDEEEEEMEEEEEEEAGEPMIVVLVGAGRSRSWLVVSGIAYKPVSEG